jgi:hypothetical protein
VPAMLTVTKVAIAKEHMTCFMTCLPLYGDRRSPASRLKAPGVFLNKFTCRSVIALRHQTMGEHVAEASLVELLSPGRRSDSVIKKGSCPPKIVFRYWLNSGEHFLQVIGKNIRHCLPRQIRTIL